MKTTSDFQGNVLSGIKITEGAAAVFPGGVPNIPALLLNGPARIRGSFVIDAGACEVLAGPDVVTSWSDSSPTTRSIVQDNMSWLRVVPFGAASVYATGNIESEEDFFSSIQYITPSWVNTLRYAVQHSASPTDPWNDFVASCGFVDQAQPVKGAAFPTMRSDSTSGFFSTKQDQQIAMPDNHALNMIVATNAIVHTINDLTISATPVRTGTINPDWLQNTIAKRAVLIDVVPSPIAGSIQSGMFFVIGYSKVAAPTTTAELWRAVLIGPTPYDGAPGGVPVVSTQRWRVLVDCAELIRLSTTDAFGAPPNTILHVGIAQGLNVPYGAAFGPTVIVSPWVVDWVGGSPTIAAKNSGFGNT
jgi:hypothetical protein